MTLPVIVIFYTIIAAAKNKHTITVDAREKVTVKKDSHSFYVKFADGKIWKNIGIDLSKREENYNGYPQIMLYENYANLIEEEQRYLDNTYALKDGYWSPSNTYTVKQLAYLYLFDPLGVEYYMRNHAREVTNGSLDSLVFKDQVYEAIFGSTEKRLGRFYFKIIDDRKVYDKYDERENFDRWKVYSNAEILFGSHTYFDWDDLLKSLFENLPVISDILLGVEIYQALFFSGSMVNAISGVASEFLDYYAKKGNNEVLKKLFGWPRDLFNCLNIIIGAFELTDLNNMTIYSKIQEQDYRTFFENNDLEMSIEEIISMCSNN